MILGGGPGGYEAALVAIAHGGEVTLVERDGLGGAAVLTDCVPSKTLIATARSASLAAHSGELGVQIDGHMIDPRKAGVDLQNVNQRVDGLAGAQSVDIEKHLVAEGVQIIHGSGRVIADGKVEAITSDGPEEIDYDILLLATGARPRELPDAIPDGERILTWQQVWGLSELPEHLIVVGSGVTGAEFAGAYTALGAQVTLVSSRDRVLPTEDPDAADVVEAVFRRHGMNVLARTRASAVRRVGDSVEVELADGSVVKGSHCLMAVGALPNSENLGLENVNVRTRESGHIVVDRVSRTSAMGVYAAGDVTGVLALASVAGMQGRIAMRHALGEAVAPLDLSGVSAAVFTDPEIAAVGVRPGDLEAGTATGRVITQQLSTNPRAKMQGYHDGFIKLVASPGGRVLGGVIVAPRASDLIHSVAIAVHSHMSVDELAAVFTVYPSMSGSIAEAARRLHVVD